MINTPPLLPMCVQMQMCEASEAKAKKKNARAGRSMQHYAAYAETIGTPPKQEKLRHLRPAQAFSHERCRPCHMFDLPCNSQMAEAYG